MDDHEGRVRRPREAGYHEVLAVGDTVSCEGYRAGGTGVVLECLQHDHVRVLWDDCQVPMTHRAHSLRRESRCEPWQPALYAVG